MSVQSDIEKKLKESLHPQLLQVENDSHKHAGHGGSPGTGESHFRVHIVAEAFQGKSRVERHRLVNEILSVELATKIHALALQTKSPDEV